jgi:hypothetical protein
MQIFENILSKKKLEELISYNNKKDKRTDARPDVISKHPRWDLDEWPQKIIQKILDQILDYRYNVEEVIFYTFKISFIIHVDSGRTENQRKGHGIIIPLDTIGPATTVFFDNYWHKPSTRFSREKILPFQYQLPNKHGKWTKIDDLRTLLSEAKNNPERINDFEVTENFIQELEYLIEARSNKALAKTDDRCYDYSEIENYKKDAVIDNEIYEKYLNHIDRESTNGLTLDGIAEWIPGNVFSWPRTQLHCAGSGHKEKTGIVIFTSPKVD